MPTQRPRLYLHIGRNKCGSTSLQSYCFEHRGDLKRSGVQYGLFGYPSPPGSGLPTFASHMELADYVKGQRTDAVLISHEGICCFQHDVLRAMASDLAELDARVILYIRPYRDWVVSSYKFDVRMGINGRDFDRYLDAVSAKISIRPMLEIWGDTVGWENVHVRSTHPADLIGGDLATDMMAAIQVPVEPHLKAERLNIAPSWAAIELIRTVTGCDEASGWDDRSLTIAIVLNNLIDEVLDQTAAPAEDACYPNLEQTRQLVSMYNDDLAFVESRTGIALQRDSLNVDRERAFLPGIDWIPKSVLSSIHDRANSADIRLNHPDVTAFVNRPAFTRYCGK